jgi:hypothetical protein
MNIIIVYETLEAFSMNFWRTVLLQKITLTLITAATLNIWRYEKNVILKTNSTQNINFIHISLIHHDIPIHPDPTLKIPAVYILHTFANEHWGIFCQNLAVRQFFLDFLSTNVISATWVSHCTLFVSLSKWDENVYSLT